MYGSIFGRMATPLTVERLVGILGSEACLGHESTAENADILRCRMALAVAFQFKGQMLAWNGVGTLLPPPA